MIRQRTIRFIEPGGRPGRPFNAWLNRWPLLGPITLATILHERGYDAAVYNENISGPITEHPKAYAEMCSADVVGISIMTPTAHRGYDIADRIRRDSPGVKLVFGGVHASFLPNEALVHSDMVVRGEGESVIEAIARGDIDRGIIDAPPLEDLDAIPTLNHFLMRDFDTLLARYQKRRMYELPVMATRGCPHGCTYCSVTRMFGRKVRRQSVEKVHGDICRYADQGFRHLFFYDDNFTSDRQWTKSLLERLGPMRMRFNAQARGDFPRIDGGRGTHDRGLLRAMRRAGCSVLYVGYETIDDAAAKEWNKGYRGNRRLAERLREDTRILHGSGFWIHGMFIMGPQHTRRTADRIVDFARGCGIETLQISILTPSPGTPLFDQMHPHLIFKEFPGDWDYYDGTHCVYDHSHLGVEAFQKVVMEAHRRFYRCGKWGARTFRAIAARPISFYDKIAELRDSISTAKTTLQKWRRETATFLEVFRARTQA